MSLLKNDSDQEEEILFISYVAVTKITIYKITLINSSLFNSRNSKWKPRCDTKYIF